MRLNMWTNTRKDIYTQEEKETVEVSRVLNEERVSLKL